MDAEAQSFMIQYIANNLNRVQSCIGFCDLMHYMRLPDENVSDRITSFQETVCYVANTDFVIPKSTTTTIAILFSTLPSDPKNPKSWDHSIKSIKLSPYQVS